jgi:hypothetical protein
MNARLAIRGGQQAPDHPSREIAVAMDCRGTGPGLLRDSNVVAAPECHSTKKEALWALGTATVIRKTLASSADGTAVDAASGNESTRAHSGTQRAAGSGWRSNQRLPLFSR